MAIIEITNLRKRYGSQVAVEDVSFAVEEGEIFGVAGRNGAGKTTTVECLSGLRVPDGGTIRVTGLDPRDDRAELRRRVGVQLQDCTLPDKIRVHEALRLYASFYRRPAPWEELLEEVGLGAKRDTAFAKLSGGQRQRLSIALALVGAPRVAILDELTTGLDPHARRETWELIEQVRARGVTIVLVTHFMEEAERLCDRLAVIDGGRVAALDTPAGLIGRLDGAQRVTFRCPPDADEALRSAGEVSRVVRDGENVTVTGGEGVLLAVTTALAERRIVPLGLHVERATLDDAFLAITGRAATDHS
ncbi:multidrug ABC transporter ATP-binding protein [Sphaerisporangium krabiense]|uniref:ABC-2 type transport system ATP-binding protein n=1 Tax=Sphaerisporangium krabiense TaxID=763782 RepID=A0A7W8Z2R7_9ACTN|nr:ABC transporter ATP-binding protein [Sphaerisporangium krabiense]MBB5626388.1 ABC-2 type transport system ATP-binding protein [Sphaerisporangium krabiense]GII63306.1 multidrug ABC transporter ATP-binding protein [Sphaerisporangium krabiense]